MTLLFSANLGMAWGLIDAPEGGAGTGLLLLLGVGG